MNDLLKLFKQGTHNYFVLSHLSENWINVIDLMKLYGKGICNMAIRSRISDIRKRIIPMGYDIEARIGQNGQGEYKLTKIEGGPDK